MAATKLMTAFNLFRIVRRRKHQHRHTFKVVVCLDKFKYFNAINLWHTYVEQQKKMPPYPVTNFFLYSLKKIDRLAAIREMNDLIRNTGPLKIAPYQTGVPFIILCH